MGLGPLNASTRRASCATCEHRGLLDTRARRVWGVFGDGEMDEPESIAGLTLAAREKLDNLTFIVNCNLQRLDGPVRGNGQIIQELESLFTGAGWNVIKVLWGSDWDALFARDREHVLLRALSRTVDGQYQTLGANDGAYNIEHFFRQRPRGAEARGAHERGRDRRPEARRARLPQALRGLRRGQAPPRPAHGDPGQDQEGLRHGRRRRVRMTAHQAKKLDVDALRAFRDRFALPLSDDDVAALRFYRPPKTARDALPARAPHAALGGPLPLRNGRAPVLPVPPLSAWGDFAFNADGKEMSTTMAAVRMLGNLLKDPTLGPRIVPIVADEARTFGMASLFRQVGIYAPDGQQYEPEDRDSMLWYREMRDGQLLEEGINEAGALSSWIAAATSYSVHGLPMLPVYIYYSMFGFQRVGDLIWAAADQRARGLLFGATAGRTTLSGEGLQHQDGSSLVMAATVPNCRAWDPALRRRGGGDPRPRDAALVQQQHDEFHYIT
jgi:pyruvate dehydrogenase E1 component